MEIQDFIENFASQFEETDTTIFNAKTKFRDNDEWSSLLALAIIAMVDEKYNIKIKGSDIKTCQTIEDLFNLVNSRSLGNV
jgi:acyl carrier protein